MGTCADSLLASIGRSVDTFRTAIFHLLFNLITVSIGLILSHQLAAAGQWLAFGIDNVGRRIANAHVLFNVAGVLVFVGFVPIVARILERLIPDRSSRGELLVKGKPPTSRKPAPSWTFFFLLESLLPFSLLRGSRRIKPQTIGFVGCAAGRVKRGSLNVRVLSVSLFKSS